MSGTNHRLSPLEARKQLLLVESEVNRAQLVNDCLAIKEQAEVMRKQAHAVADSVHATMEMVHDGITKMRGVVSGFEKNKSGWISTVINGVRIGSSLWSAVRARFQ